MTDLLSEVRYEHTPRVGVVWHEYANLFPWLNDASLAELKADIKINGVLEPIVFLGNAVLDGRNRYMAARELGIEYPCVDYIGDDPLGFVVSKNLKRRDLTASQRAAIALDIEKAEAKAAKERMSQGGAIGGAVKGVETFPPPSDAAPDPIPAPVVENKGKAREKAAKAVGANDRYVQDAKAIEQADPALLDEIKSGEKTIPQAKKELKRRKATETQQTLSERNKELPIGDRKYAAIYADPPWAFGVWSDAGKDRSADNHYPTMSQEEIEALPVAQMAADDCVLFLWATMPQLPDALAVITAWGFEYKTCAFVWVKQTKDEDRLATGMGYWTRSNAEICLLATRGKPTRINADVHQVVMAPRMEHSKKPAEVADRIERLVAGPYLEMFARSAREGWDAWGNQA